MSLTLELPVTIRAADNGVPLKERSAEHMTAPFNATLIVPLPDRLQGKVWLPR
jgi:hypothetical protein